MKPVQKTAEHCENQSSAPKTKYTSIFSKDKSITFPQYLAERMCERRAQNLNRELPQQFWKTAGEWKKYFLYQLRIARQLSAKYSDASILQALTELKYIYSLKVQKLIPTIQRWEKDLALKEAYKEEPPELQTFTNSHGNFNRSKGKLGDLD